MMISKEETIFISQLSDQISSIFDFCICMEEFSTGIPKLCPFDYSPLLPINVLLLEQVS
jgi:hypothetical protein